ncbi:HET-domain-containing protein [Byssothecium circinans]|uniref:HET-domain-containing protein n=1 Tax=Byssothecium circinans TaxID=147558 RepID=A0A6A5TPH6_9PLEO|nr:HET-domain-containing protein [Byssothecium circinans]
MNLFPDSPETYRLAKSWIQECIDKHDHVSSGCDATLPLRFLHVSSAAAETYNIHLVDTEKLRQTKDLKYTALSYCWGGVDKHKMTITRLANNSTRSLHFDSMPKTIQDAIKVTSKLGFSYLWVDSLCILQDDEEELQREIAKMSDVYSGAVVTIAATTASSASEGFLDERRVDCEAIMDLRLHDPDKTERKIGLLKIWKGQSVLLYEDDNSVPLNRRAWALQEHTLSTRILQYFPGQLRFVCPLTPSYGSGSNSISYTDGWELVNYSQKVPSKHRKLPLLPTHFPSSAECERNWKTIRENYCDRELTCSADRVLAISGVASRIQKSMGDKVYVAGHWLDSTSQDLVWYCSQYWDFDRGYNRVYPDPDWLGPSWAWTSVPSGVQYFSGSLDDIGYDDKVRCVWEVGLVHKHLVEETAPFGAVRKAILGIKALPCRVELKYSEGSYEPYTLSEAGHSLPDGYLKCSLHIDSGRGKCDEALFNAPVYIIPAFIHQYESKEDAKLGAMVVNGLVLVELPSQEGNAVRRFERHGAFSWRVEPRNIPAAKNWLDQFQKEYFEAQ